MNKRITYALIGLSAAGLTAAVLVRAQEQPTTAPTTRPDAAAPSTSPAEAAPHEISPRMRALLDAGAAAPATGPSASEVDALPATAPATAAPATEPALAASPATGPAAIASTNPTVAAPATGPSGEATAAAPTTGPAGESTAAAPTSGPAAVAEAPAVAPPPRSGMDLLSPREKELPPKMRELLIAQRMAAAANPAALEPVKPLAGPTSRPTTGPSLASKDSRGPRDPRDDSRFSSSRTRTPSKPYPNKGEYAVLLERSMFMKGKLPTTQQGPVGPPQPPVTQKAPEGSWALTGITHDDNKWMAYLEDDLIHRTQSHTVGEAVATGKIKSMSLNAIEFDVNGKVTKVSIGQYLDGRPYTPPPSYIYMPTTAPAPTADRGGGGGGPDLGGLFDRAFGGGGFDRGGGGGDRGFGGGGPGGPFGGGGGPGSGSSRSGPSGSSGSGARPPGSPGGSPAPAAVPADGSLEAKMRARAQGERGR